MRLYRLYESLTRNDPPHPVDLIFVHAGRIERHRYGLDLYRAGLALRLLLSIGRYEVSKMRTVDGHIAEQLIVERDQTPPNERHFFCEVNASAIHIEKAALRRWSTYGELLALRAFLGSDMPRSIMVISTDVHLARVAETFDRVFQGTPVKVYYCPVPAGFSSLTKDHWWTRSADRTYVFKEVIKRAAYRLILSLPPWMAGHIMRLKT